jgi:hypothetical protein
VPFSTKSAQKAINDYDYDEGEEKVGHFPEDEHEAIRKINRKVLPAKIRQLPKLGIIKILQS